MEVVLFRKQRQTSARTQSISITPLVYDSVHELMVGKSNNSILISGFTKAMSLYYSVLLHVLLWLYNYTVKECFTCETVVAISRNQRNVGNLYQKGQEWWSLAIAFKPQLHPWLSSGDRRNSKQRSRIGLGTPNSIGATGFVSYNIMEAARSWEGTLWEVLLYFYFTPSAGTGQVCHTHSLMEYKQGCRKHFPIE